MTHDIFCNPTHGGTNVTPGGERSTDKPVKTTSKIQEFGR